MTKRDVVEAMVIGLVGAVITGVGLWLVLDAYTRIAYASLGIQYP